MAFTNNWDVTQPPDTQAANQLGLDLRNVRVDAQQRMAAISGLDAAKPTFGSDIQPANWNGVLFFATDTGQVYQFNNPSWTNITSSFLTRVIKSSTLLAFSGSGAPQNLYLHVIPILNTTSQLRVTALITSVAGVAASPGVNITFGGTTILSLTLPKNFWYRLILYGGNFGATNSQTWTAFVEQAPAPAAFGAVQEATVAGASAIDTTFSQNLIFQGTGAVGTSFNINGLITELL